MAVLNPIDLIVRTYASPTSTQYQTYDWTLIEGNIAEWLNDSVDIIKLLRLLIIGKRCSNLTMSYFTLVMDLLHNTTAVTLCWYIEKREWFQHMARLTNTTSPTTTAQILAQIPALFKNPEHLDWVKTTMILNREQFSTIINVLMDAYRSSDIYRISHSIYTYYEFAFRNGLFYDALVALEELLNQVNGRLRVGGGNPTPVPNPFDPFAPQTPGQTGSDDSMAPSNTMGDNDEQFNGQNDKSGDENNAINMLAAKNQQQQPQQPTYTKEDLQWSILLHTKSCDLRLILSVYMGLTFESCDQILNNVRHLELSTKDSNKLGTLFREQIGLPAPISATTVTSVSQLSDYGGIFELVPPLCCDIRHFLSDGSDSAIAATTQLLNQPLPRTLTINDAANGPALIKLTHEDRINLCQTQNEVVLNILNMPYQLYCRSLLQKLSQTLTLDHALNSNTLPRDGILTSGILIGLAFDLVYKLGYNMVGSRNYRYRDYSTVLDRFNAALTNSDQTEPDLKDGEGTGVVRWGIGPNSDSNGFGGGAGFALNRNGNRGDANILVDIDSLDALALAPRLSNQTITDWYNFQVGDGGKDDEKDGMGSGNGEDGNGDGGDGDQKDDNRDDGPKISPFVFNPRYPIVTLLFIAFGLNPQRFYKEEAELLLLDNDQNPNSPQSEVRNSSLSPQSRLQSKSKSISDLARIALMTYYSSPHPEGQDGRFGENGAAVVPPFTPTLSPSLFTPSNTNSTTILSQQPHSLLAISTHDICWLMTTGACTTLHQSQLEQFRNLQKQQFLSLLSFDSVSGSRDEGSSGSSSGGGGQVTFLSDQMKQNEYLQGLNLYPTLLLNTNITPEYQRYITMLKNEYGTKGKKKGMVPTNVNKHPLLFLYELSPYISCYPYLDTVLSNFGSLGMPTGVELQNGDQGEKIVTENRRKTLSQPSSRPVSASLSLSNSSTAPGIGNGNDGTQGMGLSHLMQYVSIYGHFSPPTNTSQSVNTTNSPQTQYVNISNIIQSIYLSRLVTILPIFGKMKFDRLYKTLFDFTNNDLFKKILAQFQTQFGAGNAMGEDGKQGEGEGGMGGTKGGKMNNEAKKMVVSDIGVWFRLFVVYAYIHLIEKRYITAKLAVTDTKLAHRQRMAHKAMEQNNNNNNNGQNNDYGKVNVKTDIYHIEFDQFSTTNPYNTSGTQTHQQYFTLLTQYTSLQVTRRNLIKSTITSFVQNCDSTALLLTSSHSPLFPTASIPSFHYNPVPISAKTRGFLKPVKTTGGKRVAGGVVGGQNGGGDQSGNGGDPSILQNPGYSQPCSNTPRIEHRYDLKNDCQMQYGLCVPFGGPFTTQDNAKRTQLLNLFSTKISSCVIPYLTELPTTLGLEVEYLNAKANHDRNTRRQVKSQSKQQQQQQQQSQPPVRNHSCYPLNLLQLLDVLEVTFMEFRCGATRWIAKNEEVFGAGAEQLVQLPQQQQHPSSIIPAPLSLITTRQNLASITPENIFAQYRHDVISLVTNFGAVILANNGDDNELTASLDPSITTLIHASHFDATSVIPVAHSIQMLQIWSIELLRAIGTVFTTCGLSMANNAAAVAAGEAQQSNHADLISQTQTKVSMMVKTAISQLSLLDIFVLAQLISIVLETPRDFILSRKQKALRWISGEDLLSIHPQQQHLFDFDPYNSPQSNLVYAILRQIGLFAMNDNQQQQQLDLPAGFKLLGLETMTL